MKCLLVTCHPSKDSLNAALAEVAEATLRAAGHEVYVRNLYEQGFMPALSEAELLAFDQGAMPIAAAPEADELVKAEALVLVFPTWWFAMPAMLKGWFDRVWAPGVAYDPAPETGALKPRLHGLRRVVAITTLGSPWWVDRLILRRPVRHVLKTAILGVCAPRARLDFLAFYRCETLTKDRVNAMKGHVSAALQGI